MKFGASLFFTDYTMAPAALGRALEERGFESLWAPEHSHIPASRISPFPAGGDLPREYREVMDPFVILSAAAAATKTLKVGTAICLVVQRDPIQTAKSVASIDQISNGRFLFGVGAGWNAEEMQNHGTVYRTRLSLMRERIEAMREIWTRTPASYSGRFVNFSEIEAWPKPAQTPHPPIIMGGAFPFGARRAIAYCEGWLPHARRPDYDDVLETFPQFRQMAAEAGRDSDSIPITVYGVAGDLETLKRYRDICTDRVIFALPPATETEILLALDRYAELMAHV